MEDHVLNRTQKPEPGAYLLCALFMAASVRLSCQAARNGCSGVQASNGVSIRAKAVSKCLNRNALKQKDIGLGLMV